MRGSDELRERFGLLNDSRDELSCRTSVSNNDDILSGKVDRVIPLSGMKVLSREILMARDDLFYPSRNIEGARGNDEDLADTEDRIPSFRIFQTHRPLFGIDVPPSFHKFMVQMSAFR